MKIGIAGPIQVARFEEYLYLSQESFYKLGMGGQAVTAIALGLLEKGHHVSIYTLDEKISKPILLEGERLTIYVGKYRNRRRFNIMYFLDFRRKEANQIKRFIIKDKPDIINAHWSYEYAIGTIKSRLPHVICFRDNASKIFKLSKNRIYFLRMLMDKWVKKHSINFMANSLYLKENLGIDMPFVSNPYIGNYGEGKELSETDTIKIVSVMNGFSKWKNAQNGIIAFNKLIKEYGINAEYTIIGQDYEPNGIAAKWAEENGLNNNIKFKGSINHGNLLDHISEYHILLHPSLEESFGNVLIEAMAKGLVVVGGESSGAVPYVLRHGSLGVLTNVLSVDDIAQSLYFLCRDKERYKELSKEGIKNVSEQYNINIIANKYLDVFNSILK